jgi:hypothetical protein
MIVIVYCCGCERESLVYLANYALLLISRRSRYILLPIILDYFV